MQQDKPLAKLKQYLGAKGIKLTQRAASDAGDPDVATHPTRIPTAGSCHCRHVCWTASRCAALSARVSLCPANTPSRDSRNSGGEGSPHGFH